MSSCLSGGRAYRLDFDIINSSSSPSLSDSICTRKPRTPRKRPNQTYNEAAAILSTAYPKIFPTKNIIKLPLRFTSNLLFPLVDYSRRPPNVSRGIGLNPFPRPGHINCEEEFDVESILDEEIEVGIDSIMGNLSMETKPIDIPCGCYSKEVGSGNGIRREMLSMRNGNEGNWWRFPTVLNKEKAAGLGLKLNYDAVLEAWADRGSPFSDAGNDMDEGSNERRPIGTRVFSKKKIRRVKPDQRPK